MIYFIIIDNNKKIIEESIDKVLINYDIDYKIIDKNTKDYLTKDNFKIYILNEKELELAKTIRYELDDWQSIIIMIGNKIEKLIKERLFVLDYIDTNDNLKMNMERDIQIALKNYDKRPNKLKYTYKKTIYNIDYYKILYIEKEQENKRCLIKTKDNTYYIQSTLSNLMKQLDNRFIKCSKSHIINIEQVDYYDINKNLIVLKNQEIIYSISGSQKKKIQDKLRSQ